MTVAVKARECTLLKYCRAGNTVRPSEPGLFLRRTEGSYSKALWS